MRTRFAIGFFLVLTLSACRYSAPEWRIENYHSVVNRDENRFAFAVASSLERQPRGFVATFPDGGTPIVKEQKITVWSVDASVKDDSMLPEKLAEIHRPADIKSGLNVHCVGWDSNGALYVRVTGHEGKTSDTNFLRHVIRIGTDHTWNEVQVEPDLQPSLQSGPPVDHKLFVDFRPLGGNLEVAISRKAWVNYVNPVFRITPNGSVERP